MRKFFYVRVSSKDQSVERQVAVAKEMGIPEEYVFIEKASGKDFKRPEYQLMKRMLRSGDVLYIQSLDRLGRNKQMILEEWQELIKVKKIEIVVLDMSLLNTMRYKDLNGIETLISDLILQLLSYMAEDERNRIRTRQKEGVEVAIRNGVKFGRRKIEVTDSFPSVYQEWKQKKITAVEAMKLVGMKRNTFYRRVKEYESNL
ncbi:recombinase family protein [Schinkia azotoformans]|uniref:recombinase family protein n=1 Tax=Schinkia azotoformans TaxID=1454 RepID=UPI002DB72C50|nr:recombinase family protein [Schinkia azotoformans]MEC1716515.1 recombinase family protein [Schinkia azotoformans]MEC1739933.1 recombinase family protein [Schinkia azotoformans]MEC1746795.1 recombinase family protein [Schinkia azotoformans]MEC1758802.1 recombinase family protein [Schinkia azotoformans]MEC1767667.1 recombinase family protein [Schinkia azotoformans]